MARAIRLEFPGACYHVINRGNYRRNLFALKGAAAAFEGVLFEAAARCGWRVHAFVIMRNHFHLAVELTEPNLSVGMNLNSAVEPQDLVDFRHWIFGFRPGVRRRVSTAAQLC